MPNVSRKLAMLDGPPWWAPSQTKGVLLYDDSQVAERTVAFSIKGNFNCLLRQECQGRGVGCGQSDLNFLI